MEKETVKVWVSKYASTKGIYQAEVELEGGRAYTIHEFGFRQGLSAKEFHHTREAAVGAAIASLEKRIASLSRTTAQTNAKLENLRKEL